MFNISNFRKNVYFLENMVVNCNIYPIDVYNYDKIFSTGIFFKNNIIVFEGVLFLNNTSHEFKLFLDTELFENGIFSIVNRMVNPYIINNSREMFNTTENYINKCLYNQTIIFKNGIPNELITDLKIEKEFNVFIDCIIDNIYQDIKNILCNFSLHTDSYFNKHLLVNNINTGLYIKNNKWYGDINIIKNMVRNIGFNTYSEFLLLSNIYFNNILTNKH